LTTAALFGKLREHELEMNNLNEQENGERRSKGISLRTIIRYVSPIDRAEPLSQFERMQCDNYEFCVACFQHLDDQMEAI